MRRIHITRRKAISLTVLALYILTVLWFTVFSRATAYHAAQLEVFWSYKKWFAGDVELGQEIMANIAMFIPFGFLMSDLISRRRPLVVILTAAIFSLTIESLQLYLMRGLFEWDDVISNTLGAMVGLALYLLLLKLVRNKKAFSIITAIISAVFVIVCLAVYHTEQEQVGAEADTTSRVYCFQIDDTMLEDHTLTLSGFAFRYEHQTSQKMSVVLRSDGKDVELETVYGLSRPDVNKYFLCDYDYTNTGFTATGDVDPDAEYEVMIKWPWSIPFSTGVYVCGSTVSYYPSEDFTPPALEADFVTEGTLRVYRPDYHCWVYQNGWDLYWIVDQDFTLEDDGTTLIQYQMWTTQTEKLPEKRLAHNNLWDNISGYFEDYEIQGDFGAYRIMKRELPTAYSLTAIVTGYYKNGEWVWKNYFRPIYDWGEDR